MKSREREERLQEDDLLVIERALGNASLCFWPSGPNAISVSLSPMGRYVMVGLASRRILLHPSTEHMVAQVFRLQQAHGGETSMRVSALLVASLRGGSPRPGWQRVQARGVVPQPGPEASRPYGARKDSSPA